MKPTIGITGAIEAVSYGAWRDVEAVICPTGYVRAVQRAGGRPVLLIPTPEDLEDPGGVLDLIDALIVTGGAGDLDPDLYGHDPHPATKSGQEERDAYELALTRTAVERDMPTLGICRGMQVLNVTYDGTVEQHLPDVVGHERHRHTLGAFTDHEVELEPGSLAARAAETVRQGVKSHHHQGIDKVGDGLVVTGRDAEDGIVEAIEDPHHRFVLGVLWHPEEDEKSQVIKTLVSEVSKQCSK
ncbi:MAG: gamma-glutamyl-gamma-aminobutyrate hydrolase family protein [Rubrobacteraceae bacterium]